MKNFRVKKCNGFNKYKIQRRFLFLFWFDQSDLIYLSRAEAEYHCSMLEVFV